jgi:endonuclease/exonuclease/phosphatase family metal-dependent hydrolase
VYASVYISPEWIWFAGFMSWTIPGVLIVQFIFLLYYVFIKKSIKFIFPVIVLLLGLGHFNSTFTFHWHTIPTKEDNSFSVLSYNVRVFNTYDHLANANHQSTKDMIKWITDNNADIICLQEFYNDSHSKIFNTLKKISKATKKKYYFSSSFSNRYGGDFGMAIFSKYKIIDKGTITQSKKTNNQMLYVDLKVGEEVIRVYNIHLQSMSINEEDLVNASADSTSKLKLISIVKRLKKGFIERSRQLELLKDHIELSPYKVLVCGDLNDLPYGNTYMRLSKLLNNAFEEKGRGFGFTYNGKIPFLRIDNQFVDKNIKVNQFIVHREITYSDHFPLWARYTLTK